MDKLLAKFLRKENESKVEESEIIPRKNNVSKITLLTTTEGKIFMAGAFVSLLYILWLGIDFVRNPEEAQILIGFTTTEVLLGRAAAMVYGYTFGLKNSLVIPLCMILETMLVLLFYPLFVFSWRHLLVIKSLKRLFDKIQKAAVTHHDKVQKYGIIGLFAFVLFPFWMTGPMVGCVIGFLMALPAWLNLVTVLTATYIAIFCWAFILHAFHQKIAADSPFAAMIFLIIIIFIVILGIFLSKFRQENRNRIRNRDRISF